MRLLLFSFSLCLTCWGQGYNYANLPFLGVGTGFVFPFNPQPDFWWVSADLPQGPVSTWLDRRHNAILQQTLVNNRPTNTVNGVQFITGIPPTGPIVDWLTNNPTISLGTNYAIMVVMESLLSGWENLCCSVEYDLWGEWTNCWTVYLDGNGSPGHSTIASRTSSCFNNNLTPSVTMSNIWQDFALTQFNNPSGGANTNYLNGTSTGAGDNEITPRLFQTFGWANVGSPIDNGFYGNIKEILVWTQWIGSVTVSNVHYYETNTYKYSP